MDYSCDRVTMFGNHAAAARPTSYSHPPGARPTGTHLLAAVVGTTGNTLNLYQRLMRADTSGHVLGDR